MIHIDLVEDSDDDALVITTKLKKLKYQLEIQCFTDVPSAIQNYQSLLEAAGSGSGLPLNRLVLLDLSLGGSHGFELLDFLRKQEPRLESVPVIVITASDSTEDLRKTYKLGASSFLKKPFKLEDFMAVFETLIIQGRVKSL